MRFFEHGLTHGTKIRLGESPTGGFSYCVAVLQAVFVLLFEVLSLFALCVFTDNSLWTTVLCCLSFRKVITWWCVLWFCWLVLCVCWVCPIRKK